MIASVLVASAAEPVLASWTRAYSGGFDQAWTVVYADGTVIVRDADELSFRSRGYRIGHLDADELERVLVQVDAFLALAASPTVWAGGGHAPSDHVGRFLPEGAATYRCDGCDAVVAPWFVATWAVLLDLVARTDGPFRSESTRLYATEPRRGGLRRRVDLGDVRWAMCSASAWCAEVPTERWEAGGTGRLRAGDRPLDVYLALPILPGERAWNVLP